MHTERFTIPNDGEPVALELTDSGSYGAELALYNVSDEDLELVGDPEAPEQSWRGFVAGSVLFLSTDKREVVYLANNGAGEAEVDLLVTK